MTCEKLGPRLTEYHFDELSPRERQVVAEHLETCPACRAELAAIARAADLAAEALHAALPAALSLELSPERRQALREAAAEPPLALPRNGFWARLAPTTFRLGFLASIALALIVILPAGTTFFTSERSVSTETVAPLTKSSVAPSPATVASPADEERLSAESRSAADELAAASDGDEGGAAPPDASMAPAVQSLPSRLASKEFSSAGPLATSRSALSEEATPSSAKRSRAKALFFESASLGETAKTRTAPLAGQLSDELGTSEAESLGEGPEGAAAASPLNLTLVVDLSESMGRKGRLALLKASLKLLVASLSPEDRVALVAYGQEGRLLLPATSPSDGDRIQAVVDGLETARSSSLEAGLALGWSVAEAGLERGGRHVLLLCCDGVANVGPDGPTPLLEGAETRARRGVRLQAAAFGLGAYNDVLMDQLARRGGGRSVYVNDLTEAKRLFVPLAGE